MSRNYANAKDVLPQELIEQIKQHYNTGGMIYIAGESARGKKRQLVLTLAQQEASTGEIAMIAGISRRRVNQILAKERLPK